MKIFLGKVIKLSSNKTVKVLIYKFYKNLKYKKYLKKNLIYKVHDEFNLCLLNDFIYFYKSKPISKKKYFKIFYINDQF